MGGLWSPWQVLSPGRAVRHSLAREGEDSARCFSATWGQFTPDMWIIGKRAPASTNSLDPGQGAMGLVTGTAVATIHYSSMRWVCLSPTAWAMLFSLLGSLSRWVLGQQPQPWGESPSHHGYFQGECYHGNEIKVGTEGLGKYPWQAEVGEGGVVTLVTLSLVILGSE